MPPVKAKEPVQPPPSTEPPDTTSQTKADIAIGCIAGSYILVSAYAIYMYREYESETTAATLKRAVDFQKHWTFSMRNVKEGRWYTILTSSFAHDTPLDLGFAMLGLCGIARPVAHSLCVPTFMVLYFGSGLASNLTRLWLWKTSSPTNDNSYSSRSIGNVVGLFVPMASTGSPYVWLITFAKVAFNLVNLKQEWRPSASSASRLASIAFGALCTIVVIRKGRGVPWKRR
jgi:membrane associated rhomboid family serine protease